MLGGNCGRMERADAALLIVTQDDSLLETLGGKLRQWGATVHQHKPGKG
ncbi:MAG: hypothetical protein M8357_05480 [Desulfobulbaceae bacterium]|nr:hypothetical protein [Desulfobulbaceae bacterium]